MADGTHLLVFNIVSSFKIVLHAGQKTFYFAKASYIFLFRVT